VRKPGEARKEPLCASASPASYTRGAVRTLRGGTYEEVTTWAVSLSLYLAWSSQVGLLGDLPICNWMTPLIFRNGAPLRSLLLITSQ
jgi:hypothetical protein